MDRGRAPLPGLLRLRARRGPRATGCGSSPGRSRAESSTPRPGLPDDSLADEDGIVRPEFVWAALDCPSGIVTDLFGDVGRILLGRLAAELIEPLEAGATYVATAWPIARDGRKLDTGSALHTADGELCAVARARWIEVEPA